MIWREELDVIRSSELALAFMADTSFSILIRPSNSNGNM